MKVHAIELWVMVDQDGNHVVCTDSSDLSDRWKEDIGDDIPMGCRTISVTLNVEMPEPTELVVDVPALEGKVAMKVK